MVPTSEVLPINNHNGTILCGCGQLCPHARCLVGAASDRSRLRDRPPTHGVGELSAGAATATCRPSSNYRRPACMTVRRAAQISAAAVAAHIDQRLARRRPAARRAGRRPGRDMGCRRRPPRAAAAARARCKVGGGGGGPVARAGRCAAVGRGQHFRHRACRPAGRGGGRGDRRDGCDARND